VSKPETVRGGIEGERVSAITWSGWSSHNKLLGTIRSAYLSCFGYNIA